MKIIINWLVFIVIVAASIFICSHLHLILWSTLPAMTGPQVISFALSMAFVWVEILKWGVVKPFNCLKCMAGWFAVILAFAFHVEFWYMYLPAGLFAGAMFEGIKMKWL